jgi:type II secretory pathway component PulF
MPEFKFKARNKEGALVTGVMEARGREAVADQLAKQGVIPVLIEEHVQPLLTPELFTNLTRIKAQDLIIVSRQLATLLSAGVPFVQTLTTIEKQTDNPRLRAALGDIRKDIESGSTFSDALAKHPKIFSKMYVSMIHAGETAGILDQILNRLSLLAEHDAETRARVKAAVRYPLIVVVSICLAFVFLVSVVIPKFAGIFAQFKTELPLPTRILIEINHVVQNYWYLIILGIGGIIGAVIWYVRTPFGRWQWDRVKLKLPVFGILFQKVALSRFARVFGALQKSGLSMMLTLDIASEVVGNVVLARAVEEMRESLRAGQGIVRPIETSNLFPPLVVQMVSVGEETGQLDVMLDKVSDYYDTDVEYAIKNLSTMIEPILLLFIGGMVLFLALGIFLPMWNMMNLFQR